MSGAAAGCGAAGDCKGDDIALMGVAAVVVVGSCRVVVRNGGGATAASSRSSCAAVMLPPLAVSAACTFSNENPIWMRSGTLTDGAGPGAGAPAPRTFALAAAMAMAAATVSSEKSARGAAGIASDCGAPGNSTARL